MGENVEDSLITRGDTWGENIDIMKGTFGTGFPQSVFFIDKLTERYIVRP